MKTENRQKMTKNKTKKIQRMNICELSYFCRNISNKSIISKISGKINAKEKKKKKKEKKLK